MTQCRSTRVKLRTYMAGCQSYSCAVRLRPHGPPKQDTIIDMNIYICNGTVPLSSVVTQTKAISRLRLNIHDFHANIT